MITIHNIRNCDYRTETDYTVRHYDKTFDRNEDVYLYRLKANPEIIRKVFLDYLREVNRLKDAPEWYNALTDNCTTALRGHTAPYNPHAKLDWRIIVNGFGDQFIYEEKILDQSLPFEKLKSASQINARCKAADKGPDFSQRIREGLPGI
jgi:hypothetical protein